MREERYETLGKIMASELRRKILESLRKGGKIPSKIAKEINAAPSSVSRAIKDLSDTGLIECKNPELRKGRIYALTQEGSEIVNDLEKIKKR